MSEPAQDVIVVGAGVIGCAIAWELAKLGATVTLLEQGRAVRAATWASAGLLLPVTESRTGGPFLDFAVSSMRLWANMAAELGETTGIDVEYRPNPVLVIGFTEAQAKELDTRHRWQVEAGHHVQRLSGPEARELEPALGPAVDSALLDHSAAQVSNRELGDALHAAAGAAGVRVVEDTGVAALLHDGKQVSGVRTTSGETYNAQKVVLAAGAWSGHLNGLPRSLPVEPVRGQMLSVAASPPPVTHLVMGPGCYLVPRAGGRMLVGATHEHTGFECVNTPAGVLSLLAALLELVPGAAALPITETWAGLRPGSPDELPILGRDPQLEGLFYATGHYRNGILLAPVTARALADLVVSGSCEFDLTAFAVERFG